MKLFNKTPKEKKSISLTLDLNTRLPEKISVQIEGLAEHAEALAALAEPNPNHDYGKSELIDHHLIDRRIYQYHYTNEPVELLSDTEDGPLNVIVNGQKIGCLSEKNSAALRVLKADGRIKSFDLSLGGGRYKCVISSFSPSEGTTYEYEKNTADFYGTLTIGLHKYGV